MARPSPPRCPGGEGRMSQWTFMFSGSTWARTAAALSGWTGRGGLWCAGGCGGTASPGSRQAAGLRGSDGGLLGAHYLGRQLAAQGHEVRLMSTEYVRPYVKAQKNDDRDAEAIAEAATRPTMRLVALKSEAQLDVQTLHRVRDRLVGQRTALMNQMRSILLDRGIVGPQGRRKLLDALEMLSVQSAGLLSFWLMANIPPSPAVAGSFNGTDRQYWPGLKHLLLLEADRQCCSGARSS